jgi:hypothetical protein
MGGVVAGEWRQFNLGQVVPSAFDVLSGVHPSQADDVGSIPITRSIPATMQGCHLGRQMSGLAVHSQADKSTKAVAL